MIADQVTTTDELKETRKELREGQQRSDRFTWMAFGALAALEFLLRFSGK